MHYRYDPVGNITRWIDAMQEPGASGGIVQGSVTSERRYTYDAHDRLTSATGRYHQALLPNPGGPQTGVFTPDSLNNFAAFDRYARSYSYDDGGNLTQIQHTNDDGTPSGWTIDKWVSASSNRQAETYDDNGIEIPNPEQQFHASGARTSFAHLADVSYNARGRLARAVVIERSGGNPSDAEYYVYDAEGRRVRRVTETLVDAVNGTTEIVDVRYLDGCEYRSVRQGSTTSLARWTSPISAGEETLATVHRWAVDTQAAETDDPSTARIHYLVGDHLGSVSFELDESAQVVSYEEYLVYGGTAFVLGDAAREVGLRQRRFSGKLRDGTTGFYVYAYRYYLPRIGNWLSPDPAGDVDGLNRFAFVGGNPVRFVDPLGLRGVDTTEKDSGRSLFGEGNVLVDPSTNHGIGEFSGGRFYHYLAPSPGDEASSDDSIIPESTPDSEDPSSERSAAPPHDRSYGPEDHLDYLEQLGDELEQETAETPPESQAQTTPDASVTEDGTDNEASSSDESSRSGQPSDLPQSLRSDGGGAPSSPDDTPVPGNAQPGAADRPSQPDDSGNAFSSESSIRDREQPKSSGRQSNGPSDNSRFDSPFGESGGDGGFFSNLAALIVKSLRDSWKTLAAIGVFAGLTIASFAGGPWATGAFVVGTSMAIKSEQSMDPLSLVPPAVGRFGKGLVDPVEGFFDTATDSMVRRAGREALDEADDVARNVGRGTSSSTARSRSGDPLASQDEFAGPQRMREQPFFKEEPLSVPESQLGTKLGQHLEDYGLHPSDPEARRWYRNRISEVRTSPDEVRVGDWRGGGRDYVFYRSGNDLLLTNPQGEFVSMFPMNPNTGWNRCFMNATRIR